MRNQLIDKLAYQETFDCVQCGYCLPKCPTYVAFGKEKHSPRGRINLVKMVAENKIEIEDMRESIDLCLGCRACETVCPTNVQYGEILMSAVEVLNKHKDKSITEKIIRKSAFDYTLKSKRVLKLINRGMYFYEKTGAKTATNILTSNKTFERIHLLNKALPEVSLSKNITKNKVIKTNKMRVAYFEGCIMESFFSKINELALKILEKHNIEIVRVPNQTCCGALQHHAGEKDITIKLAQRNIIEFYDANCDYIVNSIGGCGATLREYDKLFKHDNSWNFAARKFTEKVRDISEIFDMIDLKFTTNIFKRAVYQPSCHLENVQKVFKSPLRVINKIPGLEYIEMKEKSMCCGSAGIYNILNFEDSMQILDLKMNNVKRAKPNLIITSNPGCHMQMLMGIEKEGLSEEIEVKHIVELIAEACGVIY